MTAMPLTEPVRREFSIRSVLIALLLMCLLPGLVTSMALIAHEYADRRDGLQENASHMAQALAQAVDGQLGQAEMVGLALASSDWLPVRQLPHFHERARTLLAGSKLQGRVILSTPDGQQVLDTDQPIGQSLPLHPNPERIRQIVTQRQFSLSGAFTDPVSGRLYFSFDFPVLHQGQVTYVLSLWLSTQNFDGIFQKQNLPTGWMGGVFDGDGITLARSHVPERFVGKKAVQPLVDRMQREPQGVVDTATSEGISALIVFHHVAGTRWAVVAAIPHALLEDGLLRLAFWLGMWALLALSLMAALVWRISQRVSSAVVDLSQAAQALGQGQALALPPTALREVNRVARALEAAQQQLQQHDAALGVAQREVQDRESRLASIINNAPAALSIKDAQGRYLAANPKQQDLLRLPEDKIVGKTDFELYPLHVASRLREHEKRVQQTRASQTMHEEIQLGRDTRILMSQIFPVAVAADGQAAICRMAVDVTEEYRAKAELREQESIYRELLDSMMEGCQILDADWRYSYINAAAEVHNQRPSEDLLGLTYMACWPSVLGAPLWTSLQRCMHERVPLRVDNEFTYPGSNKVGWFRLILQPIKGGIAILSEDITAIKESKEALRRLNEQLEDKVAERTRDLAQTNQALTEKEAELHLMIDKVVDASLAKTTFLANMSHEIRTPINAIMGLSYLLGQQTNLPDNAAGMVKKIGVAGHSLLGVINDILDFSKIEAGRLDIAREPFRLSELVGNLTTLMAQTAHSKHLDWVVQPLPSGVEGLQGDALRLEQILINLASNAIKFTERGQVTLHIEAHLRDDALVHLRFAVRDTGIGIAPDKLGVIFESFSQEDATTTRRFGGTGLGLAICRRLVELMGGELGVNSRVGEGSEFWFTLALEPIALAPAAPTAPASATQDLHGIRILAVDDSDINREVVQNILSDVGAQVTLAEDGQQALDWLLAHPDAVDLVLMDVQMPVLDGIEATRRLRQHPGFADLPIVALTAGVLQTQHDAARAAGMDEFITKPIDVAATIALIQRLHRRPTQPPLAAPPAPLALPEPVELLAPAPTPAPTPAPEEPAVPSPAAVLPESLPLLDMPKGLQIWSDTGTYQSYLKRFSERYSEALPALQQQLDTDPAAARATVHKLAGVAATLALPRLTASARALEQALIQQAVWQPPWEQLQESLALSLVRVQQLTEADQRTSA